MTKHEYNQLNEQQKRDVAWFLWEKYIDLDSPTYSKDFHFSAYGSTKLFVNERNIFERGSELFELDLIRNLNAEDIPDSNKELFPIPTLSNAFKRIKSVRIARIIPKERFHWIDFEINLGDIFHNKKSNGYGTSSSWGLGCNNDLFDWICEIPMQYIEPN